MTPHERPAAWLTPHAPTRRHTAGQPLSRTVDAEFSAQAQRIQGQHRGWLVMWCKWRRTFTAFSCFSPVPLVVDRETTEELVNEMDRLELHYSPTRLDIIRPLIDVKQQKTYNHVRH
jgi:hypothetical protein